MYEGLQFSPGLAGSLHEAATRIPDTQEVLAAAADTMPASQRELDVQDGRVLHVVELIQSASQQPARNDGQIVVPDLGELTSVFECAKAKPDANNPGGDPSSARRLDRLPPRRLSSRHACASPAPPCRTPPRLLDAARGATAHEGRRARRPGGLLRPLHLRATVAGLRVRLRGALRLARRPAHRHLQPTREHLLLPARWCPRRHRDALYECLRLRHLPHRRERGRTRRRHLHRRRCS